MVTSVHYLSVLNEIFLLVPVQMRCSKLKLKTSLKVSERHEKSTVASFKITSFFKQLLKIIVLDAKVTHVLKFRLAPRYYKRVFAATGV